MAQSRSLCAFKGASLVPKHRRPSRLPGGGLVGPKAKEAPALAKEACNKENIYKAHKVTHINSPVKYGGLGLQQIHWAYRTWYVTLVQGLLRKTHGICIDCATRRRQMLRAIFEKFHWLPNTVTPSNWLFVDAFQFVPQREQEGRAKQWASMQCLCQLCDITSSRQDWEVVSLVPCQLP